MKPINLDELPHIYEINRKGRLDFTQNFVRVWRQTNTAFDPKNVKSMVMRMLRFGNALVIIS